MIVTTDSKKYCNSLTEYSRYHTREVFIGDIPLGGNNPIRIQSMTTTDTMNTQATVEQCIRIIEAGADYVRITAPSMNEAKNLENIKKELRKRGYKAPLIADIHFTPNAAELAARIVEKVRVNPGNYADKKKFQVYNYTDEHYTSELERIREKFTPLVLICKEYGTAMRIGTNHGSLSDRIMSRYGDTPLGMVESALEFVRICQENNFYNIVLSMKASNPKVMVEAYRLLVNKMEEEEMNYPLHLGVTEAGEGEDGRIKSAVGIGTLLEDGLGDTIRVSLTEEPELEVPVCKRLVERYSRRDNTKLIPAIHENPINPFDYEKRSSIEINKTGGHHVPVVILTLNEKQTVKPENLADIGYNYDASLDKWNINDIAADYIYLKNKDIDFNLPGTLKKIFDYGHWMGLENKNDSFPLLTPSQYTKDINLSDKQNFLLLTIDDLTHELVAKLKNDDTTVLILRTDNENALAEIRAAFIHLKDIKNPVIIKREYKEIDEENLMLYSSTDVGGLLIDGLGDGIWLESDTINANKLNNISFGILQATRTRISKTEYISCPSCGRTLFDLQETTAKIRNRTHHLKGIKIAIMGCIVNGPGEMADADYGYVGSGPGKITLYKGKEVVKRSINTEFALDELITLIKENGDWVNPLVS
ncbi:MAG TPA: (E)-4-hydroxy-3-methylbut-2-enyl-diphosphate synthase [Ignavibacteria bacterium]|nr:(E)-4-hydroxy-3-methylbut-2-enyl-diphosphate synthase [Ignavibacteria bacterium]